MLNELKQIDDIAKEATTAEIVELKAKKEPEAPKLKRPECHNHKKGKDGKHLHHTGTMYTGPKEKKTEHRIKGKLHTFPNPVTRSHAKRILSNQTVEA